jgi:hypothetical protein
MYVVIDSRFGPVFASGDRNKAIEQLVVLVNEQADDSRLGNPGLFRVQKVHGPEPETP